MGRPREFEPQAAVRRAMEVFWRQGFKATSLPDLLEAMGLSRGSFYKAFGDKERLYLRALDHYDAELVSRTVARLGVCAAPTAAECLGMLFAPSGQADRGCFICNAMVELAPDHAQVAEKTRAMAGRLRGAMVDVLERHGHGERSNDLADLVLHLYFGHQAMGKAGQPCGDWQARLDQLLAHSPQGH